MTNIFQDEILQEEQTAEEQAELKLRFVQLFVSSPEGLRKLAIAINGAGPEGKENCIKMLHEIADRTPVNVLKKVFVEQIVKQLEDNLAFLKENNASNISD